MWRRSIDLWEASLTPMADNNLKAASASETPPTNPPNNVPMRIIVHDYAGHPFQVQLSRELAARGHDVLHLYCSSTHTPRGDLARRPDDPPAFDVRAIALSQTIPKRSFVRRYRMESQYARAVIAECEQFRPHAVLSANTPSVPEYRLAIWCARRSIRRVFWVQDIYGLAAYRLLSRKLPGIGHLVGKYFLALDRSSARRSDAVVLITDDFRPLFEKWGIEPSRIYVIHNWAPLENMPMRPRENAWARKHELGDGVRFVYSGTLSMKTNPAALLELARMLDRDSAGELMVVSEGPPVDWLVEQAAREGIGSLRHLSFQPFDVLPDVLGSGDVLLAILDAEAGVFAVPSKVLSYFCAGRPVLLAVPGENLASKTVVEIGAGLVVEPGDVEGFCAAARRLIDSPDLRRQFGEAGRRYAETHFDIRYIGDRFEKLLKICSIQSSNF
jgi:colanic acid biosynthesis glycosyl transferase WcaI